MLSPVRLSVVCRLSVRFVRPTQLVGIFGNFFAIWYLGHSLTSMENFTEIVSGEPRPSLGGRGLNSREVAKYSDLANVN